MIVFKFGGASVKDAASVKNVGKIISMFADRPMVVVVSAMAKTTTALENVVAHWMQNNGQQMPAFEDIINFHKEIAAEIFPQKNNALDAFLTAIESETKEILAGDPPADYNVAYDQIVHRGELISTQIIHQFLLHQNLKSHWLDTRNLITTTADHRRATVIWPETTQRIEAAISQPDIYLVQGFIGSTVSGAPTTLGREGSDYTASVFAHILKADSLTIWKDVQGVLNGDPKVFDNPVLLEEISYREAIELAYYGASVIHPKTIQPLQERGIELHVRSFLNPSLPGTVIGRGFSLKPEASCYIRKTNQILISLSTRDLAFIVEQHLQLIYSIFHKHGITVNTMQNSAISSSFCVNNDPMVIPAVLEDLRQHFSVKTNSHVSLYSIRHHNAQTRSLIRGDKSPMLEQTTRETYQVVLPEQK